jgi:hypothetical protein
MSNTIDACPEACDNTKVVLRLVTNRVTRKDLNVVMIFSGKSCTIRAVMSQPEQILYAAKPHTTAARLSAILPHTNQATAPSLVEAANHGEVQHA